MSHAGGGNPQAQLVMMALSMVAKVAGEREKAKQDYALAELRYNAHNRLVNAFLDKQIAPIEQALHVVLSENAQQVRSLEAERKEYSKMARDTDDAFKANRYDKEVQNLTTEIRLVRADSGLRYEQMLEAIRYIGESAGRFMGGFAPDVRDVLQLPQGATYEHGA